jgi:hypothetical protein
MTSSPMLHVSMLQQTSDTSWTLADGAMNTPISTIKSCDHLPNQTQFIRPNAPIMHILTIFHLKFDVYCVCGVFIIKGFTLKSEGADMYYVGDGHCSFLRIFVCNKNNYHP